MILKKRLSLLTVLKIRNSLNYSFINFVEETVPSITVLIV